MYNVLNKIGAIALSAILLTSCGASQDSEGAKLLVQAQEATDSGNYLLAYQLLDSINVVSRSEIELRKKAMHQRTIVDEKSSVADSIVNDSILHAESQKVDDLKSNFKWIKTKDMVEGYTVHRKAQPLVDRTGIEVRINEQNEIYIVSLLKGANIKHTLIAASAGGVEVQSNNVPFNGSTNYRFKNNGVGYEMVTFRGEKADSLCMFISENQNSKVSISFIGNKRHKISLSQAEAKVIAQSFTYAHALQRKKKAEGLALYYSNKIRIARQQQLTTKPTNE